jgi:hypothetical protein
MSKLGIEKQLLGSKLTVLLSGTIDEDADFNPLEGLSQPEIIFDFDKVQMLNSCGIREWISFMSKIPSTSKVIYRKCPQIIIEQINMVHGFFREGAVIESFYAPYYCESCDKESKLLLNTSQIKNRKAPVESCPLCKAEGMEFDALEEQYFHFLKNQA